LHDIGKVGIPSKILDKRSKLTKEEYKLIKSHPLSGAKIIEPVTTFKEIKPIIAQHHERYDGKGYPEGLIGETIHLGARILAVADVYDALGSDRPYRNGLTIDTLVGFMKNEFGKSFDPKVVKALLKILADDKKKAA
jgi:HD-GYP domain-containing protein (c-di-GMP phosphodiesterase class II)